MRILFKRRFFEYIGVSLLYGSRGTFFSKLNPATKLVYIIMSATIGFLLNKFAPLLILLAVNIAICSIDRRLPVNVLKTVRGLLTFMVFVLIFNTATSVILGEPIVDVLRHQAFVVIRLIALLPPVLVFVTSTTPLQIVQLVSKGVLRYYHLYPLVVAYRFIPTLFQEMKNIYDAQRSRGVELEKGGLIDRLRGLASVIIPTTVCATIRARDLAEAFTLRGFGYQKQRTYYKPLTFTVNDVLFLSISSLLHLAPIVLNYVAPI